MRFGHFKFRVPGYSVAVQRAGKASQYMKSDSGLKGKDTRVQDSAFAPAALGLTDPSNIPAHETSSFKFNSPFMV